MIINSGRDIRVFIMRYEILNCIPYSLTAISCMSLIQPTSQEGAFLPEEWVVAFKTNNIITTVSGLLFGRFLAGSIITLLIIVLL